MSRAFIASLLLSLPSGTLWAGSFGTGAAVNNQGDDVNALPALRASALQGQTDAQFRLGVMHANGQGVRLDEREAVKWLRMAARQGHVQAQSNLGGMYGRGRGIIQDLVRADMWFTLAAASGDAVAVSNRDGVERRMTPEQIKQARQMARNCAQNGYAGCD